MSAGQRLLLAERAIVHLGWRCASLADQLRPMVDSVIVDQCPALIRERGPRCHAFGEAARTWIRTSIIVPRLVFDPVCQEGARSSSCAVVDMVWLLVVDTCCAMFADRRYAGASLRRTPARPRHLARARSGLEHHTARFDIAFDFPAGFRSTSHCDLVAIGRTGSVKKHSGVKRVDTRRVRF